MPKKSNADSSDKKAIMDVSHPGKSEPDASSRPIIVSRKPIVQDPMVRKGEKDDMIPGPPVIDDKVSRYKNLKRTKPAAISITEDGELKDDVESDKPEAKPELKDEKSDDKKPTVDEDTPSESTKGTAIPAVKEIIEADDKDESKEDDSKEVEAAPLEAKPEKVIQPTKSIDKTEDKDETRGDEDKPDDTDKEENDDTDTVDKSEDKTDEKDEDDSDSKPKTNPDGSDGLVDELAKKAANKKHEDQEEKELKAHQEKMDKLVESKKYFLPIGQVTRRRKDRNLLLAVLLILILCIVGANFAVDAGLIKTDIKPLTNIFPDN